MLPKTRKTVAPQNNIVGSSREDPIVIPHSRSSSQEQQELWGLQEQTLSQDSHTQNQPDQPDQPDQPQLLSKKRGLPQSTVESSSKRQAVQQTPFMTQPVPNPNLNQDLNPDLNPDLQREDHGALEKSASDQYLRYERYWATAWCLFISTHYIFQLPVYKSPPFYEFRAPLLKQMATTTSPLTDSLPANTSGIDLDFQELKARVTAQGHIITQLLTDIDRFAQAINRMELEKQSAYTTHQNFDKAIRSPESDLDRREKGEWSLAKAVQRAMTQAQAIIGIIRIIGIIGKELMEPSEVEGELIALEAQPPAIVNPPLESPSSMSLSQVVHEVPDYLDPDSNPNSDSDTDPEVEESKKHIVSSVLRAFPPGQEQQFPDRETAALAVVKTNIVKAGSINQYFRTLPKGESRKFKNQKKGRS
ncbi:hypothetical protein BGZ65_006291 [Modicella reniformis]|uniref:Uncharacterized protein n=1 Tax=Modicella reniformis TaxID=1440133 RepID=A0A9P6IJY5_9FUNG|nr:hypothetical protein BGZ65_006291 [Modicella reniformis]